MMPEVAQHSALYLPPDDNLPSSYTAMKSSVMFRDQITSVTTWFKSWNECEQTVALCSLLRKLKTRQMYFLSQVLEQASSSSDKSDEFDILLQQKQANDPEYISSLLGGSMDHAVQQLLLHLPLLQRGNGIAKKEYLNLIPKILSYVIDKGVHIEESRQLLSYSLIHPAITSDERAMFNTWLNHLEERYTPYNMTAPINGHVFSHEKSAGSVGADWRDSGIATVNGAADYIAQGQVSEAGLPLPVSKLATSQYDYLSATPTPIMHPSLHACTSGPASFTSTGQPQSQQNKALQQFNQLTQQQLANGHRKLTRSSSMTPLTPPPMSAPVSSASHQFTTDLEGATNSRSMSNVFNTTECVTPWSFAQHPLASSAAGIGDLGHTQGGVSDLGHAPLSPQSSIASSGSGSDTGQLDDPMGNDPSMNPFLDDSSGMKDVPIWLKSLRLHKYAHLFQQLAYDEMMSLNENWLEAHDVTKGARHKIVLSITKLRERQNSLRSMEKEIMETGSLKPALYEIKSMLNTPMKAYVPTKKDEETASGELGSGDAGTGTTPSTAPGTVPVLSSETDTIHEGDLPGQIVRVLGKVCTQLLVTSRPEDECCTLYLQLLDKCINRNVFTPKQRNLLIQWKVQIQRLWQASHKFLMDKRRNFVNTFPMAMRSRPMRAPPLRAAVPIGGHVGPPPATQWTFNKQRPPPLPGNIAAAGVSMGGIPTPPGVQQVNTAANQNPHATGAFAPHLYDLKQPVQRTHSAPMRSTPLGGVGFTNRPVVDRSATEPEINAQLDSLCLSMTEHALDVWMTMDRRGNLLRMICD